MSNRIFIDLIKNNLNRPSKPATPEVETGKVKPSHIGELFKKHRHIRELYKKQKYERLHAEEIYKENASKISAKVDTEASTPAKSKSKKDLKIRSVGYTSMYQGSGRNLV